MREVVGDLWTWDDGNVVARVITTNGSINKAGEAVMGRGVAKQATERFPGIQKWLAGELERFGNYVHAVAPNPSKGRPFWLVTFPVKREWGDDADPYLIQRSAQELHLWVLGMLDDGGTIAMPRPGCGNGNLDWSQVKPLLESILGQPVLFNAEEEPRSISDRFVFVENRP